MGIPAASAPLRSRLTYFLGVSEIGGVLEAPVRVAAASISGEFLARLGPSFETKALLDVELGYAAGMLAFVWGDAVASQRGVYLKAGAVDAGSWSRIGPLPEGNLDIVEAEIDALWTAINVGFSTIAEWETGIEVEKFQALTDDYKIYVVLVDHTTDSIVNDLADDNIKLVFDFTVITAETLGYRDEAEDFRDEAEAAAATAAAVSGSGAFQAPWTASIIRTNQLKIVEEGAASPFDVIPANKHDGILASSNTDVWNSEISTLIAEAVTAKANVQFPPGTILLAAATTLGISAIAGAGGYIKIYGHGPRSIIKRADNAGVVDFCQLLQMTMAADVSYEVCDLGFDANGAGTPTPAGAFDHEHAVSIGFTGSGTGRHFHAHDLYFYDRISADHLFSAGVFERVTIDNIHCFNWDQAKHPARSDVQLSRIPKELSVTRVFCDKFESEAASAGNVADDAQVLFDLILARDTFDLGFVAGNSATVRASKIVHDPDRNGGGFANLHGIRGVIETSSFYGIDRIQKCQLGMNDCNIRMKGTVADPTIAEFTSIWNEDDGDYVRLKRPRLSADAGVVSGKYFAGVPAADSLDRRFEVIDPIVENELQYTLYSNRMGQVVLEGGNASGTVAAVLSQNTSGFYNRTILRRMDEWTAAAAIELTPAAGALVHDVELSGTQDGEICDGAIGNTGASTVITFQSSRIIFVDSDPNGRIRGIPGDICQFRNNPERRWIYSSATLAQSTVWYPIGDHPEFALTDAATIAVNLAKSNNFNVTLTASRVLGAPTNARPGQRGTIRIIENGTGGWGLTYNAVWGFVGADPALPSTAANAESMLDYYVVAANKIRATLTGPMTYS